MLATKVCVLWDTDAWVKQQAKVRFVNHTKAEILHGFMLRQKVLQLSRVMASQAVVVRGKVSSFTWDMNNPLPTILPGLLLLIYRRSFRYTVLGLNISVHTMKWSYLHKASCSPPLKPHLW